MTSSMRVDQDRYYQGYPYTKPIATDVSSIDADTASRWSNLPRRQLVPDHKTSIPDPVVYIDIPDNGSSVANNNATLSRPKLEATTINKKKPDDDPVVYIDLPENTTPGRNRTIERRREDVSGGNRADFVEISSPMKVNQGDIYQGYPYTNPIATEAPSIHPNLASRWSNLPRRQLIPNRKASISDPVVYIDIPDNGSSANNNASSLRPVATNLETTTNKVVPDEGPVVYIDLPENTPGHNRTNERPREQASGGNSPDFVEETIFYDPFEDRRIDVGQSPSSSTPGTSSSLPGSSGFLSSRFNTKETYFYGSLPPQPHPRPSPVDSLPPLIPVTEFPKPPPAYSEVAPTPTPSLPRTEVIVPSQQNPIGIASSDRKLVSCPHCSLRVHTLMVRENACITHVIAILFLFFFLPIGILIYCTDYFKYRNHYCPNCNKLIGYEIPIFCQGMTYTKPV